MYFYESPGQASQCASQTTANYMFIWENSMNFQFGLIANILQGFLIIYLLERP